jgi:hypothetical protein
MNMPLYFYDAARIFERRAAVDAVLPLDKMNIEVGRYEI